MVISLLHLQIDTKPSIFYEAPKTSKRLKDLGAFDEFNTFFTMSQRNTDDAEVADFLECISTITSDDLQFI
jgi:cob(I)alamin adenosyltransferase